jgi:hypothetical protein
MDGCSRIFDRCLGRDPLVLMSYAPVVLIGLSTSPRPGYSQVPQGTVQPIFHQFSFVLAYGKDANNQDNIIETPRIGRSTVILLSSILTAYVALTRP